MDKRVLIGNGKGIFDFTIEGEAIVVDDLQRCVNNCEQRIVVVKSPTPDIYLIMKNCLGIVSETGGLVSHLAIIGMEMGVPAILGVNKISTTVKTGDILKMISSNGEGIVYEIR